jgi:hypothetical protein
MIGVAIMLASISLWTADTSYWVIGTTLFFLALLMGNVVAPSTEAVMSAVPEEKAGVGSATNDITRQVGGAFGVAIIGSVLNTIYADEMSGAVSALPPEAADPAQDSIGPAVMIAARIGGEMGAALQRAADTAFVDGMGIAVLIAGGIALIGGMLVARFMPERLDAER